MPNVSLAETIYLYGVLIAFAAFAVTLFTVSMRVTPLGKPTTAAKASSAAPAIKSATAV